MYRFYIDSHTTYIGVYHHTTLLESNNFNCRTGILDWTWLIMPFDSNIDPIEVNFGKEQVDFNDVLLVLIK